MAMKYFLEYEMTLKGDSWLLLREIPFCTVAVLNDLDRNLNVLNKYCEGIRYKHY